MEDEQLQWTVDMEVSLFYAMRKHKPVGVNRHFQMIFIHNKLNNSLSKRISAKQIWTKLASMYDLQALNESEIIPFPNTAADFALPDSDYKEPREQTFPRVRRATLTTQCDDQGKESSKDHKDTPKEHSKESAVKGKVSVTEKISERLADTSKSDDSPKREQRKRTRQAIQSPATTDSTTSKRARRT